MKRLTQSTLLAMVLAPVLLGTAGCRSVPGAPRPSHNTRSQINAVSKGFDEIKIINEYKDQDDPAKKIDIRDNYIAKRLTLIDLNYQLWIQSAAFKRQTWDTATEIAVLGVDAAGTLTGGAETKAILAAISGGITGSKTTVDKNFFYEKTVPALVSGMEAERQKVLVSITKGQGEDLKGYPLSQAIIDLNQYYFAGTFLGALNGIQVESAVTTQKKSAIVKQVKAINSSKSVLKSAAPADKAGAKNDLDVEIKKLKILEAK